MRKFIKSFGFVLTMVAITVSSLTGFWDDARVRTLAVVGLLVLGVLYCYLIVKFLIANAASKHLKDSDKEALTAFETVENFDSMSVRWSTTLMFIGVVVVSGAVVCFRSWVGTECGPLSEGCSFVEVVAKSPSFLLTTGLMYVWGGYNVLGLTTKFSLFEAFRHVYGIAFR